MTFLGFSNASVLYTFTCSSSAFCYFVRLLEKIGLHWYLNYNFEIEFCKLVQNAHMRSQAALSSICMTIYGTRYMDVSVITCPYL